MHLSAVAVLILTVTLVPSTWAGASDDPVLQLNRLTFDGNVLARDSYVKKWLVLFCYSWFDECSEADVMFRELAREIQPKHNADLMSSAIRFAQVDCSTDKPLCNRMGVNEYPHVGRYFADGKKDTWTGRFFKSKDDTRFLSFVDGSTGAAAQYGTQEWQVPLWWDLRQKVRELGNHQSGDAFLFTLASVGLVVYVCIARMSAKNDYLKKAKVGAVVNLDGPRVAVQTPLATLMPSAHPPSVAPSVVCGLLL